MGFVYPPHAWFAPALAISPSIAPLPVPEPHTEDRHPHTAPVTPEPQLPANPTHPATDANAPCITYETASP